MTTRHRPQTFLSRPCLLPKLAAGLIAVTLLISACRPEESSTGTPAPDGRTLAPPVVINTSAATPTSLPTEAVLTPESGIAVDMASLRGIKLRFWHTWTGATAESIDILEARFNGTNPWGIWVDASPFSGNVELGQAVNEYLGTSFSADVVAVPVEVASAWDSAGQSVVDLKSYISDARWGLPADSEGDFVPGLWPSRSSDGKQIGVPFGSSARFFAYNQTWAMELGFDKAPASLEEFEQQVCAAARVNQTSKVLADRGTGGWPVDSDPAVVLSWLAAFGGKLEDRAGSVTSFNQPESEAAFTYLQSLFDRGCIWPARLSDHTSYLAGRQALLISASPQDIPRLARAMSAGKITDAWTLIPFPSDQGEGVLVSSGLSLSMIRTTEPRQLAAWLFIRWLLEPRNQASFIAGSYSLPSTYSSRDLADQQLQSYPQWQAAISGLEQVLPGPQGAAWVEGRDVLEDAFLQLFQPGTIAGDEATILEILDQTLVELAGDRP